MIQATFYHFFFFKKRLKTNYVKSILLFDNMIEQQKLNIFLLERQTNRGSDTWSSDCGNILITMCRSYGSRGRLTIELCSCGHVDG